LTPKILAAIKTRNVDTVIIREKDLSPERLIKLASSINTAVKHENPDVKVILNSDFKAALELKLDGVHFPEIFLNTDTFNQVLYELHGNGMMVGVSTHSLESAKVAMYLQADYITFSPIFHTKSKEHYGDPQGIEKLLECAQSINIPVYALGGIDETNEKEVMEAGAKGVAAIKYFLK